jgi:hypothetical protein
VKKEYFVSFSFEDKNGIGYGNCNVVTKNKLNSMNKIIELQKDLQEKNKANEVVILNWKRLWR